MKLELPEGWTYSPMQKARECAACGSRVDAVPGTLYGPLGRSWPLVGNSGPAQEREMVKAIIASVGGR